MPGGILRPSDSLVGSLCREMDRLRQRWCQVRDQQGRCLEAGLAARLAAELNQLQQRRRELQHSVRALGRSAVQDPLGLAFLEELTRRPLAG